MFHTLPLLLTATKCFISLASVTSSCGHTLGLPLRMQFCVCLGKAGREAGCVDVKSMHAAHLIYRASLDWCRAISEPLVHHWKGDNSCLIGRKLHLREIEWPSWGCRGQRREVSLGYAVYGARHETSTPWFPPAALFGCTHSEIQGRQTGKGEGRNELCSDAGLVFTSSCRVPASLPVPSVLVC